MSTSDPLPATLRSLSWLEEVRYFPLNARNYAETAVLMHRAFGEAMRVRLPDRATHLFHPKMVDHVLRTRLDNYPKSRDYEILRPILGDGIFVTEGEVWARQKKLLAPEFRASVVPQYLPVIVRDTEQLFTERWERGLDEPRDVGADFMWFTIRVVGDTLFARDFGESADRIGHSLEVCLAQATFRMMTGGLLKYWVPTPGNLRARRAERDLDALVGQLIANGRAALERGDAGSVDLLSRLLKAKTAEGQPAMTDRQLLDEVKSMILAGHETTSLALGWTFYLLDRHPEVRERLEAEADAVLGGRMPGPGDVSRLVYARMVFNEAMRLYPPVPAVSRIAREDDVVEGVPVAAGDKVVLHAWATHRHPEFWERPEAFDPERFEPEREKQIPRGAWFPFLIGRRACLGEHFAMLEGVVALAAIAGRYRLERVEEEPLGIRPISTLRYARPLRMRVRRRR